MKEMGYGKVAVAYLNNDYGTGLANAFKAEYVDELGGDITQFAAHEEGKASYRFNLAELAKGGADTLVIFDYGDGTGRTILRQALENGFFDKFVGGDGMKSDAVINEPCAETQHHRISSTDSGKHADRYRPTRSGGVANSPWSQLPSSRHSSSCQASEVFSEHLAERRHIHHRLREQLLQLCVLLFKRLQPFGHQPPPCRRTSSAT